MTHTLSRRIALRIIAAGGACGALLPRKMVVPPSPDTKLWPLLAGVPCAIDPPAQAARVSEAAASAVAAAPRRARMNLRPMAAWCG